jgi:hypothetical protein
MRMPPRQFLLLLLFLLSCSHAYKNPFLEGFPMKEFEQAGPVTVYNRSNLFDYVNGEADVYLPLGFKVLYTQTYETKDTGARMIVDAYDMGGPDGARAVLQKFVEQGGPQVQDLGDAAWRAYGLLLIQRDRYYLRVFADPSPENEVKPTLQEMLDLGRAIQKALGQ